jgi:hypothetical protein
MRPIRAHLGQFEVFNKGFLGHRSIKNPIQKKNIDPGGGKLRKRGATNPHIINKIPSKLNIRLFSP